MHVGGSREVIPGDTETTNYGEASHSAELTHHDYTGRGVCTLPGEQTAVTTMLDERSLRIRSDTTQPRPMSSRYEDMKILDWLTPVEYASQQADNIARRGPGTGQWVLDSPIYRSWLDTTQMTLFCPGIPGSGKTIITSIVVDNLTRTFQVPDIGIAYIYCSFQRQQEQRIDELVLSLLKQLSQTRFPLPETVKALYEENNVRGTRPARKKILDSLHSVAATYLRLFIVIDALDELPDDHRNEFMGLLSDLPLRVGANIFVTSRPIPAVDDVFGDGAVLVISATVEDVRRYIDVRIPFLSPAILRDPTLVKEIKTAIVESAQGAFLFARLLFDSLAELKSPEAVRKALEKFSTDSSRLNQVYEELIEDAIVGQSAYTRKLAVQFLSWITYAKRPLTTSELQHALAVELGQSKLDKANLPDINYVASLFSELVTIHEATHTVRLFHYTVQEYLQAYGTRWFPGAETVLSKICVTYLSFTAFRDGFCQTDEDFELRLKSNSFYDYAAHYWGCHTLPTSELYPELVGFLDSGASLEASSQALMADKHGAKHHNYSQNVPRNITGLHLAAYFGIEKALEEFLNRRGEVDPRDTSGRTPLSYAAERGNYRILKLLLATDRVSVDVKDENGQTPLSHAAFCGHKEVIELLLETRKCHANSEDREGRTPLSRAAEKGHKETIDLLLKAQSDPNLQDLSGRPPLHWAAINDRATIVDLLIRNGARIDSVDKTGSTALHKSIQKSHEATQQVLIEWGADLDIKNGDGQTASDLAWSKKRLDPSGFITDENATASINQGVQARCEVLKRTAGDENPQVIFRKKFSTSRSRGKYARKCLLREHRILQRLNHPFIVSYLGYDEDIGNKTAALYLEFCEGGDLHTRHVQTRLDDDDESDYGDSESSTSTYHASPLQEQEVWSILFQLAAALAYLHHGLSIKPDGKVSFERYWKPVIHRDIKPANVVLQFDEDRGTVAKLCDLGLVKDLDDEKQTQNIGTRYYTPPEIKSKEDWTLKGDIYSFGVTIDDLYMECTAQRQLRELLEQCKADDPASRPSSLSILENAREHLTGHNKSTSDSLQHLLGSSPGGYLLHSLSIIAADLDEYRRYGDEPKLRRDRIMKRLKLLCQDGAASVFDEHSTSLHLAVLLNRRAKLEELLHHSQPTDVNGQWPNSGWIPLHLAMQEDNQDMIALLLEHGADPEITDKYRRPASYYLMDRR